MGGLGAEIRGFVLLLDLDLHVGFDARELFGGRLEAAVGLIPERGANCFGRIFNRDGRGAGSGGPAAAEVAADGAGVVEGRAADPQIDIEDAGGVLGARHESAKGAVHADAAILRDFITEEVGWLRLRCERSGRVCELGAHGGEDGGGIFRELGGGGVGRIQTGQGEGRREAGESEAGGR